jgi:hypothetical protein
LGIAVRVQKYGNVKYALSIMIKELRCAASAEKLNLSWKNPKSLGKLVDHYNLNIKSMKNKKSKIIIPCNNNNNNSKKEIHLFSHKAPE